MVGCLLRRDLAYTEGTMSANDKKKHHPGPEADRLKIDGDWKDAVGKALDKEKPPEGWPNPNGDDNAPAK